MVRKARDTKSKTRTAAQILEKTPPLSKTEKGYPDRLWNPDTHMLQTEVASPKHPKLK